MKREGADRRLAFVGDVHLDRDDPDLEAFLDRLSELGRTCDRVVLVGDLFNVWIGKRDLEQPHHRAVTDRLAELRRSGVVVRYLEGNRDYRIAGLHAGTTFDDSTDGAIVERFGGHDILSIHGDLANSGDRQYRTWRRFSRSWPVWAALHLVPAGWRRDLVESLEARMRRTNLDFKRGFPEDVVRRYARRFLERGHDTVVLGHFHVEKDLTVEHPGGTGRVLVLPAWKDGRRHLEFVGDGTIRFVGG